MALLDTIKPKVRNRLTFFHIEKIRLIDNFDYGAVRKKTAKDCGLSDATELDQGIENLKKYYVVALLDPLNRHAVSESVDPFWHTHVLFTREYRTFCADTFGQFVHHQPLDPDDSQMVKHVVRLYEYTLQIYKIMFKDISKKWWPDSAAWAFKPICYHNRVTAPEIMRIALFPEKPALMEGAR